MVLSVRSASPVGLAKTFDRLLGCEALGAGAFQEMRQQANERLVFEQNQSKCNNKGKTLG